VKGTALDTGKNTEEEKNVAGPHTSTKTLFSVFLCASASLRRISLLEGPSGTVRAEQRGDRHFLNARLANIAVAPVPMIEVVLPFLTTVSSVRTRVFASLK